MGLSTILKIRRDDKMILKMRDMTGRVFYRSLGEDFSTLVQARIAWGM